jgi:site-specific recombinase XerD
MEMQRLQTLPRGQQLAFLSPHNQELVATYLTSLQARRYAASTVYNTIGTLKRFCERLPPSRRPRIVDNVASLTGDDIEAWLEMAHQEGVAPATMNRFLTVLHHFCAFLYAHGQMAQQPIHGRRHHVMVPHPLPKPMTETDLVRFFQVIDAVSDRTMFVLMLRCGWRVGEVRALTWPVIDVERGAMRIDTSKGQVDRVVSTSPDVEQALRQWPRLQPPSAP